MNGQIFFTGGRTAALRYAEELLRHRGFSFADRPDSNVTHLLLGVPAFQPDGTLAGGGALADFLPQLSKNVTVVGGNLNCPALADYNTIDFLKDPLYLAENANITAHCAIKHAMCALPVTLYKCHILVVGWGRIGKCLAALLKQMGAIVTVAARKETDRAILQALGYETEDPARLNYSLLRFRVIFNTAPEMVLSKESMQYCHKDCVKIDLASAPGMDAEDVIRARGLPGKDAPQTSGTLIADTILRRIS